MRDCVRAAISTSSAKSFVCSKLSLTFCVWVDNIYATGESAEEAIKMLLALECRLQQAWRLRLKPSSKFWIEAGGERVLGPAYAGWAWQAPFVVLGHLGRQGWKLQV